MKSYYGLEVRIKKGEVYWVGYGAWDTQTIVADLEEMKVFLLAYVVECAKNSPIGVPDDVDYSLMLHKGGCLREKELKLTAKMTDNKHNPGLLWTGPYNEGEVKEVYHGQK